MLSLLLFCRHLYLRLFEKKSQKQSLEKLNNSINMPHFQGRAGPGGETGEQGLPGDMVRNCI